MKKLKLLVGTMQTQMRRYVEPTPDYQYYVSDAADWSEGETPTPAQRDRAFANDMVYLLDGPEQREAQAEADFDYLALSARTASGEFFGQYVNESTFRTTLLNFMAASAELDRVKKLLFYGEDLNKGRERDVPELGLFNACKPLGSLVASARASDDEDMSWGGPAFNRAAAIIHGVVGVATESGEMVEALLKAIDGDKFDAVNMAEEIGDLQWYEAMLARAIGTDFDTIQRGNIDKLAERFKHLFTTEAANNRNLEAERAILENAGPVHRGTIKEMIEEGTVSAEDAKGILVGTGDCACGRGGSWGHEAGCPEAEDDQYGFTVADAPTFDEEQTAAAAEKALLDAERVKTQTVDFPDEMISGVDPMPGKHSDNF